MREPPSIPHLLPSWTAIDPASLAGVENVLILGTGHSAIDHVQLLLAAGYKGKFTLMSRHGFLPAVHKQIEPCNIDTADIPFGQRLSVAWRWFRGRVASFERGGGDWRSVLDGMRPHAQAFWQSLPIEEQRRFIRHARAWYDVRRHRLAPSIRATLDHLEGEGRLQVIAGRVRSIADTGSEAEVTFRRRSSAKDEVLKMQGIVECIGFNLDPRTARNPLLANLLNQGLTQPGPHGFGLKVSPACGLIDVDGRAASDLFAVGPLTRGQFWEAVGLPDVRQQCAQLALLLSAARPDV
ncbi:MAG: FAD/NAD(P)-binding protein [Hyphomicrobium sp.]